MPTAKAAWVDFKEIKARVSIVQILERYGVLEALSKSGNDRLSGACPIHGGTNTTHFRASISKNCWNCFGKCQSGGNIIDFVSKKEDVSFRDAALLIRDWFIGEQEKIPVPTEKPRFDTSQVEEQPRFRVPDPTPPAPEPVESEEITGNKPLKFALTKLDPAHAYLQERGLSEESIATFGLGYCGKGLFRGYIAIPIHSTDGELVAYAGRWPGIPPVGKGKYKLPEGFKKSLEVFNLHRAMLSDQEAPLVIVEGYFDCIKIHQAGYERVVALMGSTLSQAQEKAILENVNTEEGVIAFFDNDEAGCKCRLNVVDRLSQNVFVKSVISKGEGGQPEHLSEKELHGILPFPEM